MEDKPYEIRVALVGHESVGKSTVLNALLGQMHCEIGTMCDTAAVRWFRVRQPANEGPHTTCDIDSSDHGAYRHQAKRRKTNDGTAACSLNDGSAIEMEKNSETSWAFRNRKESGEDNGIAESFFDICTDRTICRMRMDTELVVIDIPGVNNADSGSKYKDYVRSNWNNFDCVVVVTDATQGTGDGGQRESLIFVNENNANLKDVPTIVLCNKLDDPDAAENQVLVDQLRDEATEIFGSGCSDKVFKELVHTAKNSDFDSQKIRRPVFIPISAMTAFIYRDARHLTMENFHKLDNEIMDKIGRDEVGRKWKKMSTQEKLNTIQKVISNPEEYNERMADTNFDKFLCILAYFIGGSSAQRNLLVRQVDVALKSLPRTRNVGSIVESIHQIYKKSKEIGRSTEDLKDFFWNAYENWEDEAMRKVEEQVDPKFLQRPLTELELYYELVKKLRWDGEEVSVLIRMKSMIRRFLRMAHTRLKTWTIRGFLEQCRQRERYDKILLWRRPDKLLWTNLSPHDWITILFSLSLASRNIEFCESFGRELNWIEEFLMYFRTHFSPYLMITVLRQENTIMGHDPDICAVYKYITALKKVNEDPGKKSAIFKMTMPEELADPCHWGHSAWRYIQLLAKTSPELREKAAQENAYFATNDIICINGTKASPELREQGTQENTNDETNEIICIDETKTSPGLPEKGTRENTNHATNDIICIDGTKTSPGLPEKGTQENTNLATNDIICIDGTKTSSELEEKGTQENTTLATNDILCVTEM